MAEMTVKLDAAQTALIQSLRDKAERDGKGMHSVEYWADECLTRGRDAINRQFDAAIDLRNQRQFSAAMGLVKTPDPNSKDDVSRYLREIETLKRKHQIGASAQQV